MATLDQVEKALMKADAAGDADAARILAAEVRRMRSAPVQRQLTERVTPQEDVSLVDRVKNFGKSAQAAIAGPLVGVAQRLGIEGAQGVSNEWHKDMAELGSKPGGTGGQVIGSAATAAPLAMIPGANSVLGGGIIGGLTGLTQPTQQNESPLNNALSGALIGAAPSAVIRGAKTVKAMAVDPFTEAGRGRIAGGVLNRMAGNDAGEVMDRLATASGNTPGFIPSVAQAARNDGISAFERTMRQVSPSDFQRLDQTQKGALVDALLSVAKTPEERAAAASLRDSSVKPFYDSAKNAQVTGDSTIDGLLKRPVIQQALAKAKEIAANEGRPFMLSNGKPAQTSTTTDPVFGVRTVTTPATPGVFSGQGLHDLKMGIDASMSGPNQIGIAAAEKNAMNTAKEDYLGWLESKIPEYGQARTTYAELSRPIGQMDIGQELYNRFVPALADQGNIPFKTRADAFANALMRNGDDLARNVTGMKNATLEGTMTPEQLATLRGVAKDSEAKAAAEAGGKGVGSDTVQKLAMSNIAAEAGIPNWMSNIARVPGGWAKRAGDVLYGNADEQVRQQLGYLLTNPQEAAQAMKSAGATPSKLAELLKKATQATAISTVPAYNALTAE